MTKTKLISVRTTDALLARLDRIARETGDTRSAVVRVLLAEAAERERVPEHNDQKGDSQCTGRTT